MKLRVFVGLALGIIALVLLFYFAGFAKTIASLSSIKPEFILPVLLLFILTFPATAFNYYVCLISVKKISFARLMKYYLFSWVAGLFALGKLGEFSMIYFLKKEVGIGVSTAVFILTKIITIIFISAASIAGLVLLLGLSYSLYILLSITAICLSLFTVFFTASGRKLLRGFLGPFSEKFIGFGKTLNEIMRNKRKLVLAAFIAVALRFIVLAFFYATLFSAFGINTGIAEMFFLASATTLIAFLPITPNGIGIREGTFAFLATAIGIPLPAATSVILVSLALSYIVGFFVALLSISKIIPALASISEKNN